MTPDSYIFYTSGQYFPKYILDLLGQNSKTKIKSIFEEMIAEQAKRSFSESNNLNQIMPNLNFTNSSNSNVKNIITKGKNQYTSKKKIIEKTATERKNNSKINFASFNEFMIDNYFSRKFFIINSLIF